MPLDIYDAKIHKQIYREDHEDYFSGYLGKCGIILIKL